MLSVKKRKAYLIMIFVGIALFFISMFSIIVLALSANDNINSTHVALAWIFFAIAILGSLLSFVGAILYILINKERIKDYIKKISN